MRLVLRIRYIEKSRRSEKQKQREEATVLIKQVTGIGNPLANKHNGQVQMREDEREEGTWNT